MTTTEMAKDSTKTGTNELAPAFSINDLTVLDSPIRTQFISSICAAAYDDLDKEGVDIFIAKCLELCGGSKELLAQTFQTRFIDDGTPLFWVLCHTRSGSDKATSIPPLVAQVFKHSELSAEILKDMELACCIKEHKRLYQLIRRQFLQCDDDITASFDRDRRWICSIRIPHFLDKMLISRTVSAPFIHWCTLFDVMFSAPPDGKWIVRLSRRLVSPRKGAIKSPNRFELNVHKLRFYDNEKHEKWMTDSMKISGEVKQLRSKEGLNVDFLRQWDDFFDKRRTLAIALSLAEWKF